ncbi:hypothetical protein GCM10023115_43340 [Pontixanthobacter gangjinensis]
MAPPGYEIAPEETKILACTLGLAEEEIQADHTKVLIEQEVVLLLISEDPQVIHGATALLLQGVALQDLA